MDAPTWRHVGDRCRAHGVEFVLAPRAGGEDAAAGSASGKFVVRDPAGNLLEFKFTNGGVGPS